MASEDAKRLEDALKDFRKDAKMLSFRRLGGMTNRTYCVETEEEDYVIRIPGEGTEELLSREDEKISTKLASDLGIDSPLYYFNDEGTKICHYITDAHTMDAEGFRKEEHIKEAAAIFRTLHRSNVDTKVAFDVFDMAEKYLGIIEKYQVELPEDFADVKALVLSIQERFPLEKENLVPCHNDPLVENWVHGEGKMHLIDWEYAGMNDPMWDLADLSIEAEYSDSEDLLLLREYYREECKDCAPSEAYLMRFLANKIYIDYLWSLWGWTRVPFDGEFMENYAMQRYLRLKGFLERI